MASETATERLAKKFAPTVRRAHIRDAKSIKLFAISNGDPDCEIWSTEVDAGAEPDAIASEAASAAIDESEANGATRFRLIAYSDDGESLGEIVTRTKAEKSSPDVIGEAMLGKGESKETALVRMALRHAETATRISLSSLEKREASLERREANMLAAITSLVNAQSEMAAKHFDTLKSYSEALSANNQHELELLNAATKNEAIKKAVNLVESAVPKVMSKIMGDDVVTPVVGILARLTPDQIDALQALGVINEDEKKVVVATVAKAQKAVGPKALPAKGTTNGKSS